MTVSSAQAEIRTSDGVVATPPPPEVVAERQTAYAEWLRSTTRERPLGHELVPTRAEPLHWTPLAKPLSECTVALVSTGGVHLRTQEPFAVYEEVGDWSSRAIPGDADTRDLTVTHTHYATQDALDDVNVMFPLDRLRDLAAEGIVGRVAPVHFGLMGFIPDPTLLLSETVPAIARRLRDGGVDVVLLTAG